MARRVFFSFHHDDIWRVAQIRNSWVVGLREANEIVDAAAWEKVKKSGDSAIKSWIDKQLLRTSVTVILIGSETAGRRWVKYEIEQSIERNNGFVGVRIHNMKDQKGDYEFFGGHNPLEDYSVDGRLGLLTLLSETLSDKYKTYNWINDNGRANLAAWVEEAARIAGR